MGDSLIKPIGSSKGSRGGKSLIAPIGKSTKGKKKYAGRFGGPVSIGGKGASLVGRAADVVVDDAKSLAVGIPKEAWESGKAAVTLTSPYSSSKSRKKAAKTLAGQAAGFAQGVEEVIPNPESLPFGDVSLVQVKDGDVRFWVKGGEKGDSARAAEAWKNRPLTSLLTTTGVLAPGAGAISIGRLAKSIRKENRTISKAEALRLARRESRNPGFLAAQGMKGGIEPRILKSRIEGGKTREVEFPQARSAIGRRGQDVIDTVSKALPDKAPLSERRRANRQIARDISETERRAEARAANLMAPIRKVAFSPLGRKKKGNQALLAYALQTPHVAGDPFSGPKAVVAKYDEILKAGAYTKPDGGRRAITTQERTRLELERNRLVKALIDQPDPTEFALALSAMQQVAKESDSVARYITQGRARGVVSADEAARLDKVFDDRRNLLSRYLGIEGEALGYFPHRTPFELRNTGGLAGARGAGDVLGTPRGRVNMKKNELRLFHSGKLDTDPRVLERTYVSHLKFLEAETNRRQLFDEAVPLDQLTGKEGDGYLIRDPDTSPAPLSAEQRALHDPRSQALGLLDEGDEDGAFQAWRDQWLRRDTGGIPDEWADTPEAVRWVPRDVVDKRLPRRVAVDPEARARPLIGTVNALARVATIQGKPARYLTTNSVQNILLGTITSPLAVVGGIKNQAALLRAVPAVNKVWKALRLPDGLRARRPDIYRLVAAETGDVQATAGLPTIRSTANTTQRVEVAASVAQHSLGEALGSVADSPYRVAMYLKHAKRMGFKSDAQLERLLTSGDPNIVRARRQVMQSTRDDMYDFNRLSTWERDTISRFFFLWPLVRAGIRYPSTYTRDYPVRAGAAASLTLDDEPVGDVEARDLFKFPASDGTYDTAWVMPQGITVQQIENLRRVMSGDLLAIGGMLSPPLRDTGSALFGYERPFGDRANQILRNILPGYATVQDVREEGWRGEPAVKRFSPQKEEK